MSIVTHWVPGLISAHAQVGCDALFGYVCKVFRERQSAMNTLPLTACAILAVFLVGRLCWRVLLSRAPGRGADGKDPKRMAPYPAQPIKGRERYRIMMDVRKMDSENWLTIDTHYMGEHRVRSQLLQQEKSKVLQCLPESHDGCMEVLEEVVRFLCGRFPGMFESTTQGKETTVRNKMAGETFVFGGQSDQFGPLEIAARLTMEDLSILMKNADGEYYLSVRPPSVAAAAHHHTERPAPVSSP